jgi:outer membrane protein TolC
MTRSVLAPFAVAIVWFGGGLRAQEMPAVPTPLALADAKRYALAGNPGVEALMARVNAAEAVVGQARAARMPQLNASAGAAWLNDVSLANGNADNVPFFQVGLAANWLLFDGFATTFRIAAAKAGSDASLANWHDGRRLLAEGVATAFLNCLLATEVGRVTERDAQFNRELLDEAQKRVAAGAGPHVDVLNFRVRVRQAENELLGTQREVRSARAALAALLGLPPGELPAGTELAAPATAGSTSLPAAEEAIATAFAQRPDLLQYQHTIAQLDATIESARGEYMPKLFGVASYAFDRAEDPQFNRDRDASSYLGLGLSWGLFDGGRRHAAVAEVAAQRLAVVGARNQLRIDIAAAVRRALDAATTAVKQSENQREITDMSREIRDLVRKEYLSGMAALTRLNEAQTDLVRAEGRLSQMRIHSEQAVESLAAATGGNLPER